MQYVRMRVERLKSETLRQENGTIKSFLRNESSSAICIVLGVIIENVSFQDAPSFYCGLFASGSAWHTVFTQREFSEPGLQSLTLFLIHTAFFVLK